MNTATATAFTPAALSPLDWLANYAMLEEGKQAAASYPGLPPGAATFGAPFFAGESSPDLHLRHNNHAVLPELATLAHTRSFRADLPLVHPEELESHWQERGALLLFQRMAEKERWAADTSAIEEDNQAPAQWPEEIADALLKEPLQQLAHALQQTARYDTSVLGQFCQRYTGQWLGLLGMLSSGRAFALLDWLARAHPAASDALLEKARTQLELALARHQERWLQNPQSPLQPEKACEHSDATTQFSALLLQRLRQVQRSQMLHTVFSPERAHRLIQDLQAIARMRDAPEPADFEINPAGGDEL